MDGEISFGISKRLVKDTTYFPGYISAPGGTLFMVFMTSKFKAKTNFHAIGSSTIIE
jgi:hypothetical protein